MAMMTLDQWKTTRRVDHEQIVFLGHVFNRRMRPRPNYADLKVFDEDVTQFHLCKEKFDKVGYLGDIIADTAKFIQNAPTTLQPRYLAAVQALQDSAKAELAALCNTTTAPNVMAQDILALAATTALTPKTVAIKVHSGVPSGSSFSTVAIDARVNGHLVTLNQFYNAAGVGASRINATAAALPAKSGDRPLLINGCFDVDGGSAWALVKYCNSLGDAAALHVVYVDRFKDDDVQGFTCRRGGMYNGLTPNHPIVVMTLTPPSAGAATYDTTLTHEVTHALTDVGSHSDLPDSLMAAGANRNGTNNMSLAMLAWLRNNETV